jgi:hypothetical protein
VSVLGRAAVIKRRNPVIHQIAALRAPHQRA